MLRIINNWESLSYFIGKKEIHSHTGGVAIVKWPDLIVEELPYIDKFVEVDCYDSGHTYSVMQHQMIVKVEIHGLFIDLQIENIAKYVIDVLPNSCTKENK